jgi:hypothetical protein
MHWNHEQATKQALVYTGYLYVPSFIIGFTTRDGTSLSGSSSSILVLVPSDVKNLSGCIYLTI